MLTVRKTSVRTISNKRTVENKGKEATVYLYGDIGGYFGVDHQQWVQDFNAIDASTIHLRIDSQGGDVFAARAMKTAIMQHKAKVIAHIDGLAASAASFLAMGADEREIVDGGFFMIHNALSFLDVFGYFNAQDMRDLIEDIGKEINLHDKINESIANDYAKVSGKTQQEMLAYMDFETWFTAKEAQDVGLVNRIYDGEPVEGTYDLSVFANVPEAVMSRNTNLTKRTMEKAMRDAGISNKVAKKILAEGFKEGDQRDVEPIIESATQDATPQRDVVVEPQDKFKKLLTRVDVVLTPTTN
jgi:ATP-dependent Clp protease, protease subunit